GVNPYATWPISFFFSSRRRHTRWPRDWSSDVCSSDLHRHIGKGFFDDVTVASGLGVETRYVGWGAGMVDLDNDGLPDLFITTGEIGRASCREKSVDLGGRGVVKEENEEGKAVCERAV